MLPHITLDSAPTPQHSVLWLHGLGADGSDFVPLAEQIKLPVAVRYLFPHAPKRAVTINGGFVMRAWYDIFSTDLSAEQDAPGIHATQLEIEKLIEQEQQRGIAPENIFLAGFSQGGAIALHTGLRYPQKLGGILALSTYLPLADTLPAEISPHASTLPIFMAHGKQDTVIPSVLGRLSAEKLQQLGCAPQWHEYTMPHSVCAEEIGDIERWLSQQLT